jgi:hypothetical protein
MNLKEKNEIKMGESHSLSDSIKRRVNKKEKQYYCKHKKNGVNHMKYDKLLKTSECFFFFELENI